MLGGWAKRKRTVVDWLASADRMRARADEFKMDGQSERAAGFIEAAVIAEQTAEAMRERARHALRERWRKRDAALEQDVNDADR